jgi:general secretion pathway protein G
MMATAPIRAARPANEEKVPMVSMVAMLRMLTAEVSMNARALRKRRLARARGVTLIEVMIVVVILGLIAGGVAVAVFPKFTEAQIKTTRTSAMELRRATETWRATHASDQCPTLEQLRADKAVDSASKLTDAWDDPFKIVCQDDETVVSSFGHDKKEGTADDIIVPETNSDQK